MLKCCCPVCHGMKLSTICQNISRNPFSHYTEIKTVDFSFDLGRPLLNPQTLPSQLGQHTHKSQKAEYRANTQTHNCTMTVIHLQGNIWLPFTSNVNLWLCPAKRAVSAPLCSSIRDTGTETLMVLWTKAPLSSMLTADIHD